MVVEEITFHESDIRPEQFKDQEAKLFAEDLSGLLEHRDAFVHVACPACAMDDCDFAFDKYGVDFVRCLACETMYVNPRPTSEMLDYYYSTSRYYKFWNDFVFPASEETRREKIFRPRVEKMVEICRRLGVGNEKFLEVGAGFGTFCEELQHQAIFENILALEPTPSLAETCRLRGIETIQKPIERITPDYCQVDVIASFEVIEHLFSPAKFISQCFRLLAPGGLLILTCPNAKGFDIRLLNEVSDSVEPEHLNYFHPQSLSNLVEANGFVVEEVSTPGRLDAELVRKKHLDGLFGLEKYPFLHQLLTDQWDQAGALFQTFLAESGLSSHLWLVARKPFQ